MHSETGWLSICTIDVIRECGSFIVAVLAEDVICEDVIQFAFEFYMYQIAVDLRVFVFETETIFSTFQFVPLNVDCPFFSSNVFRTCVRELACMQGIILGCPDLGSSFLLQCRIQNEQ
jgi:hypothetical protein